MFFSLFTTFISDLNAWTASCKLSTLNRNNQINALFWGCLFFSITFQFFTKLLRPILRKSQIEYYKWTVTIRCVFCIGFYTMAIVFLFLYQKYFLASSLYFKQNGQNYYRSYENLLFHRSNNSCSAFNTMNLILMSFYTADFLYDLNQRAFTEAVRKLLACCITACFNVYRLEYFAVTFNILIGIFNLFVDTLRLIAWHTSQQNRIVVRICVFLKVFIWSYIFLNLLPFKYLIPTLNGRKFYLDLNVFLWLWYGASVWNSPILQYFYHQIYHINNSVDCIGANSISRCILIRESQEIRHYRNLQKAIIEIQLTEKSVSKTENPSAKAYQTIKCMIALKRKLRRIRETKQSSDKSKL